MKRPAAGSVPGWLLLAACAALLILLAWPEGRPEPAAYVPGGYTAEAQPIRPHAGTVDVNHADLSALMTLPGVGEQIAAAIIDERRQNGPFFYPEDLCAVRGIGPAKAAGFRDLVDLEGSNDEVE